MTGVSRLSSSAGPERAAGFLRDALESARTHAAADRLLLVTLPAPLAEPVALWSDPTHDEAWLWQEPGAEWSESAVGNVLPSSGRDARLAMQEAWRGALRVAHPSAAPPPPRAVGGACFDPDDPADAAWAPFGASCFLLPRWRFVREGRTATLTLAARHEELDTAGIDRLLREHGRLTGLLRATRPHGTEERASVSNTDEMPLARWTELVDAARSAIAAGHFTKLVTARRTCLTADGVLDPARVLAALARVNLDVTVFGLRMGGSTFLGATPETLVSRSGLRVRTEALAGTAPGADADVERLLASAKDRHEQSIVVEELTRRLRSVCSRVDVPEQPRPQRLRHVTHLRTPIEGELLAPLHVLDLVRLLHPTPAVAGFPREDAVRWITRHEPHARGWFAGPVGWFNEQGDGRFAVAIRSALMTGNQAFAYAGAGIVEASAPPAEYAETGWKLRAMTAALLGETDRGQA